MLFLHLHHLPYLQEIIFQPYDRTGMSDDRFPLSLTRQVMTALSPKEITQIGKEIGFPTIRVREGDLDYLDWVATVEKVEGYGFVTADSWI